MRVTPIFHCEKVHEGERVSPLFSTAKMFMWGVPPGALPGIPAIVTPRLWGRADV